MTSQLESENPRQASLSSEATVWYKSLPDPMVLIFAIIILAVTSTYFVPAGEFERHVVDGVEKVDPDSYRTIESKPASVLSIFVAVPRGLIDAGQYLFIVFIAGGLFHLLKTTGALENAVGTFVKKMGSKNKNIVICLTTFIFGFFGMAVGFENNLALIPIGALIGHALARSATLGAGMAVGGIGVGFALSPINPYTVGVAQGIAELELFSGAWLRSGLLVTCLSCLALYLVRFSNRLVDISTEKEVSEGTSLVKPLTDYTMNTADYRVLAIFVIGMGYMLFGVFRYAWYINEIAGVFLAIAMAVAISERINPNKFVKIMMEGASSVTAGALVIGLAAGIKVVLDDAKITDTLVYWLSLLLGDLPVVASAILMTLIQGIINLFIPGGSGQALVTMPIMVPLGDIAGVSRQLCVLAFQIGDGLTNLISPTSGGTLAMLALARVSFSDWLKFIFPFWVISYLISWLFIVLAFFVNY